MFATILKRLAEPSTWAGVSVLLMLLGVPGPIIAVAHQVIGIAPDVLQAVSAIGGTAAAAVAVALPESGGGA